MAARIQVKVIMRIGIDIRGLDTSFTTGVDTYLRSILEVWLGMSRSHTFFMLGTKRLANDPLVRRLTDAGHELYVHAGPVKAFNAGLKFFKRPYLDVLGKTDVFFLPHPMFHAFSRNAKTVITFHDLSFERLRGTYSAKHVLWHWFVDPRQEALRASRIVTVSESTGRDVCELYGIASDKIKVIPLGVDREAYAAVHPAPLSGSYILYLGSIEPRKNVLSLVQAFTLLQREFPELQLVLAGGFFPQKDRHVLRAIKDNQRIILQGQVNQAQKVSLYQHARVTVLPSLYEGFGLQIVESFAAGTPVVASSATSMPEVAAGAALLANPLNPAQLAEAMRSLLISNRLRTELVTRGHEVARTATWEKTARQTLAVLEETVYTTAI